MERPLFKGGRKFENYLEFCLDGVSHSDRKLVVTAHILQVTCFNCACEILVSWGRHECHMVSRETGHRQPGSLWWLSGADRQLSVA